MLKVFREQKEMVDRIGNHYGDQERKVRTIRGKRDEKAKSS